MPLPTPLNNNCLIEVIKEYEGVSRFDEADPLNTSASNQGKLLAVNVTNYHLTASAALKLEGEDLKTMSIDLKKMIGQTVRWEDMSETTKFDTDDKSYVLVPWWRLTTIEGADDANSSTPQASSKS